MYSSWGKTAVLDQMRRHMLWKYITPGPPSLKFFMLHAMLAKRIDPYKVRPDDRVIAYD